MVKRSRHRRPLLSPLSLSLHLIRACQIRLMSSSKRKNVIPCRSPHTLISSEVKSASKSDKRDIPSVGRPDRNVVEAKMSIDQASGLSPQPPQPTLPDIPGFLRESDEVKYLGSGRLRCLGDLHSPYTLELYKKYLEWFYYDFRQRPVAEFVADAACQCLEKECNMRFWWLAKNKEAVSDFSESSLSQHITDCMFSTAVQRDESLPFGVDAALCIAKEAEFVIEWLRRRGPFLTSEEYALCHKIRSIAITLFDFKGNRSSYISAALLVIRREAEVLIKNLRVGSDKSISTSMEIRQFAYDFIIFEMCNEYPMHLSEMASEFVSRMASENCCPSYANLKIFKARLDHYAGKTGEETKRIFAKLFDSAGSKNCLRPGQGSHSLPPTVCPNELKLLQLDRLLPPDPRNLQQYRHYLELYYDFNKEPGLTRSVSDAANLCLEKMNTMDLWAGHYSVRHGQALDPTIIRIMFLVVDGKLEMPRPFGVDAALCLAKEAELITELLKTLGKVSYNYKEDMLSYNIRTIAYQLFTYSGKWVCSHIAAALLSIRKEAERRIENLKLGSVSEESITTYLNIRQSALDFLEKTVEESYSLMYPEESDSDDPIDAVAFW